MPNTLLTPTAVTREALRVLHQKARFVRGINRQYDDSFAQSGAKIGDSLKIRLPNQYTVRSGATLSAQDTTEVSTTLQVATQKGVDLNFTSVELTLSLDDFSKRILQPAMAVLAAAIEADALAMYKDVYNIVGTAGTTPAALLTYLSARQKLVENLTPQGDWEMMTSPLATATIVDALKGLFQSSTDIKDQYRDGVMGRGAGFDWIESTLMPTHTMGTQTAAALTVNGGAQTGATLNVNCTNAATVKAGTVITIAGVNRVHPETKVDTGALQQFVVTADVTFGGITGAISISPSITTSGATQTVTASPANAAVITYATAAAVSTGYVQNLAYHPDAFAFATADLVMPKGIDFAAREVYDGVSMRIVRQYDINNDKFPCRLDVLYGYKAIRPQLACRVTN
jgi:hypothetical protein